MIGILALAIIMDLAWQQIRRRRPAKPV